MEAEEKPKRSSKKSRGVASLILLLVALGFCVRLLGPDSVGEHVRRSVVDVLSKHYEGCTVSIASGRYDPNAGFVLSDIEIRDASLPKSALPLLAIDRLLIETQIDLASFKKGTMPVRANRILMTGLTLNAWPTGDNHWSSERLFPVPSAGPGCPLVVASGVRIRVCAGSQSGQAALELNEIGFSLAESTNSEGLRKKILKASGTGDFLESLKIEAMQDFNGATSARGEMVGVDFDSRVYQRLPADLRDKLKDLANSSAHADVRWQLAGTKEKPFDQWAARVTMDQGRFAHEKLPVAVEQIRGSVLIGPGGVTLESIQAEVDGAACQVTGSIAGFAWPCPVRLDVKAQQLTLSEALLSILPPNAKVASDKIQPRGRVDLEGQLYNVGTQWNCDGVVTCRDLAVTIDRFPYPVKSVRGVVRFKDRITTATDLTFQVGDATVVSSFQLSPLDSPVPFWIELKSLEPLKIDENLISALTPRGESQSGLEKFVRTLAPRGSVRLLGARFDRGPGGINSKQIDLEVVDGRLRYSGFSYPLYEVRGRISVDDQRVQLSHFQAQNTGGAQIQCEGQWVPIPQANGGDLDLTFRAYSILLDDGLRAALPAAARQTWDTLSPSGTLERLEVNVVHNPKMDTPELTITAEQWGNPTLARKELSVTPVTLPYRLDIKRGIVRMAGDRIVISEMDGYHGSSRLTAEGQCLRRTDGRWQLDLNVLSGSRLRPDSELVNALPPEIRGSFAKLQLREPVSLRGTTELILPDQENPSPIFSWNMLLQLEGNRIGDVGPVHDIRGEIAVRGTASGDSAAADGTVRIDSMHVYDLQLTDIQGPFVIRGSQLRLGAPADPPEMLGGEPEKQITGKLFEGNVRLKGDVLLSTGGYNVDIALERANLATLLIELDQNQPNLRGLFGGKVQLEGNLGATNLLRGTGKAALTEATIYQLPVIIQVFNQLRLVPAEDVAFTKGTTNFSIDGDLLTLTDLNLWGDLVALIGGGTVNGRQELDLAFNTRVSPQNVWSRLVSPLRSSKYALWTISVRGTLSQPQIEGTALEAVGETLERLFPVMDRRWADLPLATGFEDTQRTSERRPTSPKTGSSPWAR